MKRYLIRGTQVILDLAIFSIAYWLAFLFRFEFDLPFQMFKLLFFTWPYVVILKYLILSFWGVPSLSWRYIGIKEVNRIIIALSVSTGILTIIRFGLAPFGGYARFVVIPLGVLGTDYVLSILGAIGVRTLRRVVAERAERGARPVDGIQKRTLLIGAGSAGVMISRELTQNPHLGMKVVGFIDDDPNKIGTVIQGHRVLGDTSAIAKLKDKLNIEQVVISIASAAGQDIRRIVDICETCNLPPKIIPGIFDILSGKVNISRVREVTIDDLLGREAVKLDAQALSNFLSNKTVMVTGAGGSIGSELCRQVVGSGAKKLILLEQAENPLFDIHGELRGGGADVELVPCIADVCDVHRVDRVFETYRPQVIFHAAAHKHVPMMEWNPGEAVKNNVIGTATIADAADQHGAEAFVLISTDKAVNPTSIMGATKRVAELYIQDISKRSETTYVAVRFGNVLGSAGSVVPIFKEQISRGGPVTVTHPEMKRYFMTIPEACQLVMQAATMGEGGEIFVLDMGAPVKIVDLAKDLIRLSGFTDDEIQIEFSGMRPGEKLFEELLISTEEMTTTRHPKIYIGKIAAIQSDALEKGLGRLRQAVESLSRNEVAGLLDHLVPETDSPKKM